MATKKTEEKEKITITGGGLATPVTITESDRITAVSNGNNGAGPVTVRLAAPGVVHTADESFWALIRNTTEAIGFNRYSDFLDRVMCDYGSPEYEEVQQQVRERPLPFPRVDTYNVLKVATEVFLMKNCGVTDPSQDAQAKKEEKKIAADPKLSARKKKEFSDEQEAERKEFDEDVTEDEELRLEPDEADQTERQILAEYRDKFTVDGMVPYLDIIREKLRDIPLRRREGLGIKCYGILRSKLTNPCLLELIWSYWHEEGMLMQTTNAIAMRFQNRKGPASRDPLANLELDALRPINSLLWGFVQDEQHRLSVVRRAYEYDHHYGISLRGKAIPPLRTADSRSKFLEGFHRLLYLCSEFYKQLDDMTMRADGFPVLNALREVHLTLTQGGHNQFGDLPWTARQEMLMSQWLLARPEMREFIPGRVMVAYPEPWMDRVDAMKTLQGWSDSTIIHFRELGIFGERIMLGIRFGAWAKLIMPEFAANWARFWRPEIQGYMHAYRAVTGVDLTNRDELDNTAPSVHLRRRLATQSRNA